MRRETEPIVRLHVHLYESDVERLRRDFGGTGPGVALAIRRIIRAAIKRMDEKEAAKLKPLPPVEVDL